MTTRIKKRHSTEVRRRQIADAARALTVKYGSEHITVRRIAKEIGVSEGALYRHFKSKRDILSFMIERIEEDLTGDLKRVNGSHNTPLEILEALLRNHVSAIEQRRGTSFQVIAEIISLGDKKLNRQVSAVLDSYTSRIREILEDGIQSGELRKDIDPETTATLIAATLQGLVNKWALANYSYNLEQEYLSVWGMLLRVIEQREDSQAPA